MAEDVTKKVQAVAGATADVKKQQEELDKKIKESTKNYELALQAMRVYTIGAHRDLEDIIASTVRLNVDVENLAQANKDGYEYLVKKNQAELEANEKQIESLSKNISKREELMQVHEKQGELIAQKGLISKAQLEQEYELLGKSLIGVANYDAEYSRLMEERGQKILASDKATKNELIQNSLALHTVLEQQSKDSADKIIEHAGEVVKHTGGFLGLRTGVIDVGAQKEHLEQAKTQLNDYLSSLKSFGDNVASQYNGLLINDKLTADEKTQIEKEREAFLQKHNKFVADETKRVNGELETIEKSSQSLRLQQFNEYIGKYQSFTTKIFEGTQAIANVFKQQSEMYKAEVAKIDQEIEDNKTEQYEYPQKLEDKKTEIAKETKKKDEAATDEAKKQSEERINTLTDELTAMETNKKDFGAEEERLKNEKRKKEKQAKDAEKMQKRIEMGQQIVKSIGDIAAGAAKALSYGPILGPILAAVVSAAGAIQVGIMTKQLAKMENGGLLRGKRHREGGMPILGSNIEVEGGEFVVNRQSTGKNLGLLGYINSQRRELSHNDISDFFASSGRRVQPSFAAMLEEGGQLPAMLNTAQPDSYMLMDAIQSIKFEPKVSVTDINSVQADVVRVDNWVGM